MDLKLIMKGFVVGIGKIIPGVSGSMLAVTMGIYEKIIKAITNFFDDIKNNSKLLINFGIGVLLAIVLFSRLILFLLNNYYYEVMYLFLGLIIATLLSFIKEVKFNKYNIFIMVLLFFIVMVLSCKSSNSVYIFKNTIFDYLYIILLGIIDAFTSIVPGISGTAIYMVMGCYSFVLSILSKPNSIIFVIYGIGLIIGIISVCYIMNFLFERYPSKVKAGILGLMLASLLLIFMMLAKSFKVVWLLYLILGLIMGYKLQ